MSNKHLDEHEQKLREPIAITGIGCRAPGAGDAREFWQLLREGRDAVGEVPPQRWAVDPLEYHDAQDGDRTRGGFLEDVKGFDWRAFGITPREARYIDPQQRLALEVAWEALEDAGLPLGRIAGARAGVFFGVQLNDYHKVQCEDLSTADPYTMSGNTDLAFVANRISYFFDLTGPSMVLGAGCASSLSAVHYACRCLSSGESDLALAGGVSLLLRPDSFIIMGTAQVLARDGRSKPFASDADGLGRGEGAGVVVLKRLSDALRDGDRIYATVLGSASKSNGHNLWIMGVKQESQEALLADAYRHAGVEPGDIDYVELHGPGTPAGDPVEAAALGSVVGSARPAGRPCLVGSAKGNIGHLEAAAGVIHLIKTALSLQRAQIPPTVNVREVNPELRLGERGLHLQRELVPWPDKDAPHLAGVTSLSFGGANAHVVLQQQQPSRTTSRHEGRAELLPLSARTAQARDALAPRYIDFLKGDEAQQTPLCDIAFTACSRRTHHRHRLAVVGTDAGQMAEDLQVWVDGENTATVASGEVRPADKRRVCFVFPGQGPQWWAMGRQLMESEPVFREAIDRCDHEISKHADWSLLEELTADEQSSRINDRSEIAQPALFAIQVALASLWRSWGIEPDAVIGHSMGEVAACYVAGILSFEDAVRVIVRRSQIVTTMRGQGRMAFVDLSPGEARRWLRGHEERVSVASHNSPTAIVLSGDPGALESIVSSLEGARIFCRFSQVDYASHCPQMDRLLPDVREGLDGIRPQQARVPMISSVTAEPVSGPELTPDYWAKQLRQMVRFCAAMEHAIADGLHCFVEVSAHPVLSNAMVQCVQHFADGNGTVMPSLRRHTDEHTVMFSSLARLYALGADVNWEALHPEGGHCTSLPPYPWQREELWLPEGSGARRAPVASPIHPAATTEPQHPLLGRRIPIAHPPGHHVWESAPDPDKLTFLHHHRLGESPVLPGTGYIEMAIAAGGELFGGRQVTVEDVTFHAPLVLSEDQAVRIVQVALSVAESQVASFHVHSRAEDETEAGSWTLHATGRVRHSPPLDTAQGPEAAAP